MRLIPRGWVTAGRVAILLDHVTEGEVLPIGPWEIRTILLAATR